MKVTASNTTLESAKEVLKHNNIVHQGDKFEVFEVPENITRFEGYALLLFRDAYDFAEGDAPSGTMIIPVTIKDRKGYFIDEDVAQNYS